MVPPQPLSAILISTILSHVMAFELLSLFLFVFTADRLHSLFTGAMCAAGTLYVNSFGYPTLMIKIANCVACGVWLVVNYTDNKGFDYPLIKIKYIFLLAVTASILTETLLQWMYFLNLKGDVITSCCGTLFSIDTKNIVSEITAFSPGISMIAFYTLVFLTIGCGLIFYRSGTTAYFFSILVVALFLGAIAAIISFISLYFYELPSHHCPFCLLQKEYHYVGYVLYISLLGGGISGAAVGVIELFKNKSSLRDIIPLIQRRLCLTSVVSFTLFAIISTWPIVFSDFKLLSP